MLSAPLVYMTTFYTFDSPRVALQVLKTFCSPCGAHLYFSNLLTHSLHHSPALLATTSSLSPERVQRRSPEPSLSVLRQVKIDWATANDASVRQVRVL